MAIPAGGNAALFYDIGQWYNERDVVRVQVPAGNETQHVQFKIPAEPIKRLRFDLTDRAGVVYVKQYTLLDGEGGVLDQFGPEFGKPMHSIEGYALAEGTAVVQAGGDNPMLLIDRPLQGITAKALNVHFITTPTIVGLGLIVLISIVYAILTALRSMPDRKLGYILFTGAFLTIFGLRLLWLNLYSRPMPYWDEWETDGVNLLMPFSENTLHWGSLLLPQSEHRTIISRLIMLVSSILNSEWDPRVSMFAGTAMYAASMALICSLGTFFRPRYAVLTTIGLIILASFPFDARNLLCGDQCQMYALNLMAAIILCLSIAKPTRSILIASALASAVSLFTMASGFVAPLLAMSTTLFLALYIPEERRARLKLSFIFLLGTLCGVLLYSAAPFQAPSYSRTISGFLSAFIERLSWPLSPGIFQAVLVWSPWLILLTLIIIHKSYRKPVCLAIISIGAWAFIHSVGFAHGRPFDHWPFDNRYYTSMSLVIVCSWLLCMLLINQRRSTLLVVCMCCLCLPSFLATASFLWRSPGSARSYWEQQCTYDKLVRPYLRTGDRSLLHEQSGDHIPYWNGAELAAQLDSPHMQKWLPSILRQCFAERSGYGTQTAIEPGPITIAVRTSMKAGPFLAVLGLLVLYFGISRQNRLSKATVPCSTPVP